MKYYVSRATGELIPNSAYEALSDADKANFTGYPLLGKITDLLTRKERIENDILPVDIEAV